MTMFPTDKTDEYDSRVDVKRAVPRMPILEEREKTHGDYIHVSRCAQLQKDNFRKYSGWQNLGAAKQESLDLIATKIARILNGDPNETDHWRDIAGYANLVVEILGKKEK